MLQNERKELRRQTAHVTVRSWAAAAVWRSAAQHVSVGRGAEANTLLPSVILQQSLADTKARRLQVSTSLARLQEHVPQLRSNLGRIEEKIGALQVWARAWRARRHAQVSDARKA